MPEFHLADPLLQLLADVLDDTEKMRVANENRLRQLTRDETDADGIDRGFGLTVDHPTVARIAATVSAMRCERATPAEKHRGCCLEHDAELNLVGQLKQHPLHPWIAAQRGIGAKQAARLLAAVGDPYWNDLHERPRLVSELWSYCGLGDAARQIRRRGERSNWSDTAKKRAWLVSKTIVKQLVKPCHRPEGQEWAEHVDGCACSPYRRVYDEARRSYAGSLHPGECKRCGPSGKPAQPGSPRSLGHQEAMALRLVSKEVLRDLWREGKRLHELHDGQVPVDAQPSCAVVDPTHTGAAA